MTAKTKVFLGWCIVALLIIGYAALIVWVYDLKALAIMAGMSLALGGIFYTAIWLITSDK